METTSQYRYRIEHATRRVVTFTPWHQDTDEPFRDIGTIAPGIMAEWDMSRQAYISVAEDGSPAFYFVLETRQLAAGKAFAFHQP
jgi:hypothetical protein